MKIIKKLILAVDAGNYKGKVVGPYGALSFKSNIAETVELKVVEKHGEDDMSFEVDGRTGLAGSVAEYESIFGASSMQGETKAHWFTKVRVLLGISRYLEKYKLDVEEICVVVGQPFKTHTPEEKDRMKAMLKDSHHITVNEKNLTLNISEVGVAPEGVCGYYSSNKYGTCRLLDIGSGTINAITIQDYFIVNKESDTFNFGTETKKNGKKFTLDQVATGAIINSTNLGWNKNDIVMVCGGSAGVITEKIMEHYPNAEVTVPTLILDEDIEIVLDPEFANGVGMYDIAKLNFK